MTNTTHTTADEHLSLEEQAQALAELDAEMNPAPSSSVPAGFVLGPNGVLLPVSVVGGHSAVAGSSSGTVGGGAGSSSIGAGSATGGTIGTMGEGLLGMNVTLGGGGGSGARTNNTSANTNTHHVPSHAEMARVFAEQRLRQQVSRSSDVHHATNSIATAAASHPVHTTVTTAATPAVPGARFVTPTAGTSNVSGTGAVSGSTTASVTTVTGSSTNTSTTASSRSGDLVSRLLSVEEGQEHTLGTQPRR